MGNYSLCRLRGRDTDSSEAIINFRVCIGMGCLGREENWFSRVVTG